MQAVAPRRSPVFALAIAVLAAVVGVAPPAARATELTATPATFASVFAAAKAGDTVLLAAGSYGTFRGAMKSGTVTVKPAAGATAAMAVDFDPAANIRLEGVTISGLDIADSRSHDLTIARSRFTGQAILRTGDLVGANVVLDRNTHAGWDACSGCSEARVWLPERTSRPSGVTIKNSTFGPGGVSDGIQNGGNGVRILDNEFVGLELGSADGVHTDAIQLYGSRGTVIRGNWMHDVPTGIMAPDGADHEVIEHNVIDPGEYPFAIMLWSDIGSIVRHNTLPDGACDYNLRCGILSLGSKSGQPAGAGTVVTDNILGELSIGSGSARMAQENGNLLRVGGNGAADLRGTPTYVGGARPMTKAGFALAGGSIGKGNATDGTDRGAAVAGAPTPRPSPAPAPTPSPTPAPTPSPTPAPTPAPTLSPPTAPIPSLSQTPSPTLATPPTPSTGPVATYPFDEAGGPVALDASGSGNHGRLRGAKRTRVARHGRALAFDGRDDDVLVPHSNTLDLTTAMTLEAWLRPTGRRGRWHTALIKGSGGSASYALHASDARGRPVAVAGAAKARAPGAGSALKRRAWSHLAVTYDGRLLRVYVNGRPAVTRARADALAGGRGPLRIGGNDLAGRRFRGQIDDVRVYDRALGPQELRRDMDRPA